MKLIYTKRVLARMAATWMLAVCLALPLSSVVWAESAGQQDTDVFEDVVEGPFDGLDLKARRIWVNDMVYLLDRSVKVKGTPQKLGLITDLKVGEHLRLTLRPNDKTPSIPYVILIER